MKKKSIKKTGFFALFCAVVILTVFSAQTVYAYDYARTGATKAGTVTAQVLPAGNAVNGYILPGGYRINYSVTNSNWTAFDSSNGCDFYIGNNLKAKGGCHFVYAPNGEIWEQGAIALGSIKDGKVVGSCSPNANGKVQVSFDVSQLSELPEYIAYTYQPAGGAYVHMSETFGANCHVWFYQKLNSVTPGNAGSVDTSAPDLSAGVTPSGKTATVNGKVWGTCAIISATASDSQSRPGGLRFYKSGGLIYNCTNSANTASFTGQYTVTENAAYQVNTYDQLGNTGSNKEVVVNCIDTAAPSIVSFKADKNEYCTELTLNSVASDSGCGLHATAYSFNNGEWCSSNSLKVTENGTFHLQVRDALGNIATKSYTVNNIDTDGPILSAEGERLGEEISVGNEKWSREKRIRINASDEKSGLERVIVTDSSGKEIENRELENRESGELSFETDILPAGQYLITAYDILGNKTESNVKIDFVDNDPPEITAVSQEAINEKTVRITISAKDNEGGSGLPGDAYSFDGGKTWQNENYKDVEKNGTYELAVRDNVGLQDRKNETVNSIVDKKDPDNTGSNSDKEKPNDKNPDKAKPNDGKGNGNGNKAGDLPANGDNSNPGNGNGGNPNGSGQQNNSPNINPNGSPSSSKKSVTGKKNSDNKEKLLQRIFPKKGDSSNSSISENTLSGNTTDDEVTYTYDKNYQNRKKEVEKISSKAEEAEKKVRRIATIVLVSVLILGLLALGAYFLLTYLYYSCVLYAIDDQNNRKRLCRIPIKPYSEDWIAEVPDHKLGTFGNGRYVLVFRTSFVKESDSDYIVITIDKNRIREKLREEIEIKI